MFQFQSRKLHCFYSFCITYCYYLYYVCMCLYLRPCVCIHVHKPNESQSKSETSLKTWPFTWNKAYIVGMSVLAIYLVHLSWQLNSLTHSLTTPSPQPPTHIHTIVHQPFPRHKQKNSGYSFSLKMPLYAINWTPLPRAKKLCPWTILWQTVDSVCPIQVTKGYVYNSISSGEVVLTCLCRNFCHKKMISFTNT